MLSTLWGSGAFKSFVSPRKVETERGWAVQPSVSRVDMTVVGWKAFKVGQLMEGLLLWNILAEKGMISRPKEGFYIRQVKLQYVGQWVG